MIVARLCVTTPCVKEMQASVRCKLVRDERVGASEQPARFHKSASLVGV